MVHVGVGRVMQGWGGSYRGGVGHVGVGWGGSCRGGGGHAGVGSSRVGVGGSCRGGWVMQGWVGHVGAGCVM